MSLSAHLERRWRHTGWVKHSSELLVDADSDAVFAVVSDLSTYPSWNDLVSNATSVEQDLGDPGPAWRTTLRAQVGPLARSKQLRFVRDDASVLPSNTVRFARRELDGRDHADWTMEVQTDARERQTLVTMTLAYDGGLWIPALGGVLDGAIERATRRLPDYLEAR